MKLLACFLLAGCSYQSIEALTDDAQACGTAPECKPLWDRVYKREDRNAEKERQRQPCPRGYVKYADWTGQRCITQAELEQILRQMR